MATEAYGKALRMAQRAYRSDITRGRYPYLQVLDELLSFTNVEAEADLGLVDIPLDQVVGTKTAGRTRAFASNFMPLLGEDSEFAMKWISLYRAHMDEGIRDPIIAYEFMNRFYVVEGNKRVSVLKYVGAVSIPGYVTRVIPKRSEEKENRLYYEFLDFYRDSQINYIWFSELGSFPRLCSLIGKDQGEAWSDDDRTLFRSSYIHFSDVYKEKGGDRLSITCGDAFLVYLGIYGYEGMADKTYALLRQELSKIWDDLELYPEKPSMKLVMQPVSGGEAPIIKKLIPTPPPVLKVAFIHDKTAETSGWTYGHELGRMYLESAMEGTVKTAAYDQAGDEKGCLAAIGQAVRDGCTVIFITSSKFLGASIKAAVQYPSVKILNCSVNTYCGHLRTYYGRLYEAKFLSGLLAGILTDTDAIGYIADYPIFGMTANINAFALGVKMVNPRARVFLAWSTQKGSDPEKLFRENHVGFVSGQDLAAPGQATRSFGLYDIRDGKMVNIAFPVWHWGKFYERILRSIQNGRWKRALADQPSSSVNYWWGLSSGMIDFIASKNIPKDTAKLLDIFKNQITIGQFNPFSGPIADNQGKLQCADKETLSPEKIITMDWLAENVCGYIPGLKELTAEAQEVVKIQGVRQDDIG